VKFTAAAKTRYLEHLAAHGRPMHAADAAGVTSQCVRNHQKDDPDFHEQVQEAKERFRDKCWEHAQKLCFKGTKIKNYDREGNVISERREYPIALIQTMLKKHDPELRDRSEIDVNVKGGVLVAPAASLSSEEWEKLHGLASSRPPEGDDKP
jgi:hypothetical protein